MKKLGIIIGVIIGILLLIILMFSGTYNSLNASRHDVENAYAKIETQLQRRYDLIPNLVNVTKGYMEHESEIFTKIAESRNLVSAAKTQNEKIAANMQLDNAISRLLVIQENYPILKSDIQAQQLMAELAGTENRIQVARTDYNDIANTYNKKITQFPNVMFASALGFSKVELYQAVSEAKTVPNVNLKP